MSFTGTLENASKRLPGIRTAILFTFALGLTMVGILGFAQLSRAAPVSLKFDNGRLSMGALLRDQTILPAPDKFPSESLPVPQRTDIELLGTETDGELSFPAALNTGAQFPYFGLNNPLDPNLPIPATFRLNEPGLTGTYDAETGAATLDGLIDIIIITGPGTNFPLPDGLDDLAAPPLGLFARCRVSDVPVAFSTSGQFPYAGRPFEGGFGVNGALSTEWMTVVDPVSENGGECDQVHLLTRGYGGIWLSNGIVETHFDRQSPPGCAEDPLFCPDSEPGPAADISSLRLIPARRTVRAGKRTFVKVRIRNSGNADSGPVAVRLKSSNRRVRIRKKLKVRVPAGSTVTRKVKVRAGSRARGKSRIMATAAGKQARAKIRIRPAKR